jgi:hypothetical protein
MRKAACILLIMFGLTACITNIEMPHNNATGSDLMRQSPCVCLELDYNGRGFKWSS